MPIPRIRAIELSGKSRKCRRCKNPFNPLKGSLQRLCGECRKCCAICGTSLTPEILSKCGIKRFQYFCRSCVNKNVLRTRGNRGFSQRNYDLLRNYGITEDEYERLLKAQGGLCWICNHPPKKIRLSVDHKHEPGEKKKDPRLKRPRIRGLLCWHCNNAIAKFRDSPDFLRRAADYLEKQPAQEILNQDKKET